MPEFNFTPRTMKHLFLIFILSFAFSCVNPPSELKEAHTEEQLGELLFFDPILSSDSSVSCASCHKPEFAFADNSPVSKGVKGKTGNRSEEHTSELQSRVDI